MKPITVTLDAIRKAQPCEDGWEKLLKSLGKTKADSEPLPLITILESNGVEDAIWCLRCMHSSELYLGGMFAAACAEAALSGMKNPDKRLRNCIRVARQCSLGLCSKENADLAAHAAYADIAARSADAADAVYSAAYAASAARAARSADYADLADYTAEAVSAANAVSADFAAIRAARASAIFRSYFGTPKTKKQYIKMFKLESENNKQ